MTKTEILKTLRHSILNEMFLEGLTEKDLTEDVPLFGDKSIGLDSLDTVELVMLLEKHFGIILSSPDEVGGAFANLSALADFILERQTKRA